MTGRICFVLLMAVLGFNSNAQLPGYVPTSDLTGFYSYSGNVLDNSGNGNNNANYSIVSTTDRFNMVLRALYFSGTGAEYLDYGDVNDYEGGYQLSLSFWILPEAYGGDATNELKPIISKWSSSQDFAGSTYLVAMNSSDLCLILSDGVSSDTVFTSLSHILLNQWSHVTITFNYGLIKIYVNDILVNDTGSSVSFLMDSNSGFKVGTWYSDVDPSFASFSGKVDDIGIWKRELSDCEVEALYTGVACPTATLGELNDSEISISPNPANEFVTISSSNALTGTLKLFNASGQLVHEQQIEEGTEEVQVSTSLLPEGVYVAQIADRFTAKTLRLVVIH
ncbi:MAG: hypothetical protein DCO96_10815 [Fluviicola sp. XM-24bin1]|nr:MAG: hypothetical protein DCO96_10815 [Fluviicola sp. XM-24bin1]